MRSQILNSVIDAIRRHTERGPIRLPRGVSKKSCIERIDPDAEAPAHIPGVHETFAAPAIELHYAAPVGELKNPAGAEREAAEQQLEAWWAQSWGWPTELGLLGEVLPAVLGADTGHWSRTDIDRVMAAVGWPAAEHESGDVVAHRGDGRLTATATDRNGEWFGFGDFQSLQLTFACDHPDRDAMFISALRESVQLLGIPDLVGGPDARAIWRRGGNTITLCRGLATASVHLNIEPTAARDAADLDAAQRSEWEPYCSWLAWPDESRRHDVGVIGDKEPTALDLAEFESNLNRLFESLTWDLPLLHPYATYVIWQLSIADRTDWFIQGWFCAYAQHRLEIQDNGETHTQMYPHDRNTGRTIAAATTAAVRASGVTQPGQQLRFRAWMSPEPQGLQAFRFGLEWDER